LIDCQNDVKSSKGIDFADHDRLGKVVVVFMTSFETTWGPSTPPAHTSPLGGPQLTFGRACLPLRHAAHTILKPT